MYWNGRTFQDLATLFNSAAVAPDSAVRPNIFPSEGKGNATDSVGNDVPSRQIADQAIKDS